MKLLLSLFIIVSINYDLSETRSIILANYHNVLLFFPKEYGGNDDLRVIFDVRNTTINSFKYLPVVVSVAYDSDSNNAYCYLESATTSYILLLKWNGGRWCYQILFEFQASQFYKHMYHSVVLMDNFIYWTTDKYIMSGRLPNYEKRVLLQPAWNRLYSMTLDKPNRIIYVAAYDYTENALFSCTLTFFSCTKLLTTEFTLNYAFFSNELYLTSIQSQYLYRYSPEKQELSQLNTVQDIMSSLIILDDQYAIYTDQLSITMITNFNLTRKTDAHLIDPYALQYVFSPNKIFEFDTYPNWLIYPDYQNILYRNNLYLFYFYICGMDYIENDLEFLPQMDTNNRFLRVQSCENRLYKQHIGYLMPAIIAGSGALGIICMTVLLCLWRNKLNRKHRAQQKAKSKSAPPANSTSQQANLQYENQIATIPSKVETNRMHELYNNRQSVSLRDFNYRKHSKISNKSIKKDLDILKIINLGKLTDSPLSFTTSKNVKSSYKDNVFKIDDDSVRNSHNNNENNKNPDYDDISSQYQPYNTFTHITPYSSRSSVSISTSSSSIISYSKKDDGNFVTTCQIIPVYSLMPKNYLKNQNIKEEEVSSISSNEYEIQL